MLCALLLNLAFAWIEGGAGAGSTADRRPSPKAFAVAEEILQVGMRGRMLVGQTLVTVLVGACFAAASAASAEYGGEVAEEFVRVEQTDGDGGLVERSSAEAGQAAFPLEGLQNVKAKLGAALLAFVILALGLAARKASGRSARSSA